MKADHNTITPFGVKVLSKYKVLSKLERGVINKIKNHHEATFHSPKPHPRKDQNKTDTYSTP